MEQVLAWYVWPDSLLLDQSFAWIVRGGLEGKETRWCHCLALQSYRERRRRSLAAECAPTMAGANPGWMD